jgi:hypothetical protein
MPPLFRDPCLQPSPRSDRQQQHGSQVIQEVKNVERLGQFPLKQHARLLHQVGLWINRRDGHPNREQNQQGKGNPINPTHKALSFSNVQLYLSFARRLRCKRMPHDCHSVDFQSPQTMFTACRTENEAYP